MLSTSDEQTIIAYILDALDGTEAQEVSDRLQQDASFCRYYTRVLNALKPILRAMTVDEEEVQIRQESEGLASRTMTFLRQTRESLEMASQPGMDTSEQMMETLADTCAETKVAKNSEQVHEPEYHPEYK
ncbi:MAG: hypothetical protein K6C40_10275 [Thermoguttaceae bacterium]|nr:hypothetical protein [Thermoguttaceae bacterium]